MHSLDAFIHKKIVVLPATATVHQAARALCEQHIGCVVLAGPDGRVAGIVTDRDLACEALGNGLSPSTPVSEVMPEEPLTVSETASVEQVIELMSDNGVRRVPVVTRLESGKDRCVGMVTLDDLIAARLIDVERLSRIVRRQIAIRHRWALIGRVVNTDRAEARAGHTLHRFYNVMATRMGVAKELGEDMSRTVVEHLIRRIHFNAAAHILAQLPKELREWLLDVPAGPDRSLSLTGLLVTLERKYALDGAGARAVLRGFGAALGELLGTASYEHFASQLPADYHAALGAVDPSVGERAGI